MCLTQYFHSHPDEDEVDMSTAVVTLRPSASVACRVPDRRIASLTASEELPPGIPAQVTFVAAHHCAGCGQPRSHAYHKDNPLIPGQVAPASLCRKCETKVEKGEPIDSIVLPIRDFGSDGGSRERGRKQRRHRSNSRTRVVVRYESQDRDSCPPPAPKPKPSPEPPKRSISFRHIDSRSLSRSAAKPEPKAAPKKASSPQPPRQRSPPRRHSRYIIEHIRDDRSHSTAKPEPKPAPKAAHPPPSSSRSVGYDSYYDRRVEVDVRRRYPSPGPRRPAAPAKAKTDIPPPPMGLSAVQSNKRTYHRQKTVHFGVRENHKPPAPPPATFDHFLRGIFKGKHIFN